MGKDLSSIDFKALIGESWGLTRKNKKLIIWYAFFPAILTTLVGILYFTYQILSTYRSKLFNYPGKSILAKIFSSIVDLIENDPEFSTILIVSGVIIFLMYLILPTIFDGGLISLTARISNHQPVRLLDGISYGMLVFLPLFKYHLLIKSFGVITILTEAAFIGRNLGWLWLKILFLPLIVFAMIGFVLLLLFTYSEYYIVIDEEELFPSIKKSTHLVIRHWPETIIIAILMVIITIRILINTVLVILVPTLIILPIGYITTQSLGSIGIAISILIAITALLLASYFAAIIEVFAKFVWVKLFLYLTTKKELHARDVTSLP